MARTNTTPAPAAATPAWLTGAPRPTRPCECAMLGTGCTATTARTFAPGHDAKAKSLLIKAHRTGDRTAKITVNGTTHTAPAREIAKRWGFAHLITDVKVAPAPKAE